MKQIICLASEPWLRYPHRTQQLLSRLTDAEILYFEPPLYLPAFSKRRNAPRAVRNRYSKKPRDRKVRSGTRSTIHVCPLPPIWPMRKVAKGINNRRMLRYIQSRLRMYGFRSPALWVDSPFYADLLKDLDVSCTIYDYFTRDSRYPSRMQDVLVQAADVILSASPSLSKDLEELRDPETLNMALIPDGADCRLFSQAGDNAADFPEELFNISGPILGFAGVLSPGTDFNPLLHAAILRPDWTFVLAGRLNAEQVPSVLRELPNVLVLPCRTVAQTAEYAAHFDLFFQLSVPENPVPDRIPPAALNALSTGKPLVLMTEPGQPPLLSDLAIPARSNAEFAAACRKGITDPGNLQSREDRQQFAAVFDWNRIASEVARILEANGIV